jgi:hypothetical protein
MRFVSLLLIVSPMWAMAVEFDMEHPFRVPAHIPEQVIQQLRAEMDQLRSQSNCGPVLEALLESTTTKLNTRKTASHMLVKPSSVCLCAVNTCPFWIFERKREGYAFIGKIDAHTVKVLKGTNHGYHQISSYAGTAGWSDRKIWRFDGQHYVVHKRDYREPGS